MARRSSAAAATVELPAPKTGATARFFRTVGTVMNWTLAACALIGAIWGALQIEQFILTDRRFVLEGPPEPGVRSEHFQVQGLTHASDQQITNVFYRDFGRSIYLCPIAERRRSLLAVDWVKEATVSRVWPNRILVRIQERAPVAFVQIPSVEGTMVYGLVDADGVMLDPRNAAKLALPVLAGMPAKESEASRRERVKRFLRLQTDLAPYMDKISEIDVADKDNLKITQVFDGAVLTLMLGNQQFLQRYQNFHDNYPEIRKRLPNARELDLRLKDRITAVAEDPAPAKELVK